jgi:hypothetical protein
MKSGLAAKSAKAAREPFSKRRAGGNLAIKLYWPDKASGRRDKIDAMVTAAWSRSNFDRRLSCRCALHAQGNIRRFHDAPRHRPQACAPIVLACQPKGRIAEH